MLFLCLVSMSCIISLYLPLLISYLRPLQSARCLCRNTSFATSYSLQQGLWTTTLAHLISFHALAWLETPLLRQNIHTAHTKRSKQKISIHTHNAGRTIIKWKTSFPSKYSSKALFQTRVSTARWIPIFLTIIPWVQYFELFPFLNWFQEWWWRF